MAITKWIIDKAHSQIQFRVKHLMITTVTGGFSSFDASVETEGSDFMTAKIIFMAETASVSTGNDDRDAHIKSSDFFDVVTYPQIKFVITKLEKLNKENAYKMYGDLVIKNVSKNIGFDVEFTGMVKDPWGNNKAGFIISGKVDRRDFGLRWNVITEAGSIMVGEEARILCNVQLTEQK